MQIAVVRADSVTGSLTPSEQTVLASIRGPRRREEWTRGRFAAHQLVEGDVLVDADGAPHVATGHISISHDGAWIAVARDTAPIGIDLCARTHAARIPTILRWLGVTADDIDPVAQWAALEAVLKLRRLSVEALRDRAIELRTVDGAIIVRGIGADVRVSVRADPEFVVALCGAPCG